jgi:hypothetical protein
VLHAPRFAVWLDGREWVRSTREKSYVVGFRLSEHKFGPFRESGYSALRAASVRTPQFLRPDRSFTYPVLRVKKVISYVPPRGPTSATPRAGTGAKLSF